MKKAEEKKTKIKKTGYLKQVVAEMKKVSFPSKKEIVKYTVATIIIVAFMIAFFELLSLGLSVLKEML